MSDFDNFDDLDAVRDFRSLATPYPGAIDTAVRRRIFEQAAARGYTPQNGHAVRTAPTGGGGARRRGAGGHTPAPGAGPSAVAGLHGFGRARSRRSYRYLALLVVALVAVLLARRPTDAADLRAAEARAAPAAAPSLSVDGWIEAVRHRPDRPLGPGEFAYRKVVQGDPAAASTRVVERWAAVDQPGLLVLHPSADEAGAGQGETRRSLGVDTAFGGLPYARLRGLPPDPAALDLELAGLQSRLSAASPVGTLLVLLGEPVAPPEVQVAAITALARRGLDPVAAPWPAPDHGPRSASFQIVEGPRRWLVGVDPASGAVRWWEHQAGDGHRAESSLTIDLRVVTSVGAA